MITDSIGNKSYIPFIINNTSSITGNNGILLIANTNTWCAYNDWGGASGYGGHDLIHPHISAKAINSTGRGSILRPNPRLDPTKDDNSEAPPNPRSHLLGAEIWIYDWFENYCSKSPTFGISPQIKLNLASDQDLHFTTGNLYDRYKIIVLSTHPEYWTRDMFEKLSTFRNSGGSIFYLGGNGVYEMVKYFVPVLPETILGKPILFRNGKKGNVSDRDSYGFKDTVLSTLEGFNRNMLLGCTYYTTSIPNPGEFYTVSNRGNITDAIKSSFDFILSNPSANGLIFSTIGKDQSIYLGHSAAEWEVDKFDDVLKTAPPLNFANNFVCDKFATSNDTGNLADIVFIKSKSTPSFVLTIPAITTGASLVYMTQASNGAPIIRGNISQIVNNALNLCLGVNFTVDLT